MSDAVELTDALLVHIKAPKRPQSNPLSVVRNELMDWQREHGVYAVSGTMSCGPHFFHGVFDIEDAPAIREFFAGR